MGRKKVPYYRIVAVDSRVRRDGKYLEKIGHYNPLCDPVEVEIDKEKAFKWLDRGAIPTDTVKSLLQHRGLLLEWDLKRKGTDPERIEEELKKWEVLQIERQKRLEAKAAMEKRAKKDKAEAVPEEEEKAKAGEPEPSEAKASEPEPAEAAAAKGGSTKKAKKSSKKASPDEEQQAANEQQSADD
jgi:small subunit ribosomal protein S16